MRPELRSESRSEAKDQHRNKQYFWLWRAQRGVVDKTLSALKHLLKPFHKTVETGITLPLKTVIAIEKVLDYSFNDKTLLTRALTHRSILAQYNADYSKSNELLEFLGDAVLDLVVAEYLYNKYPEKQEGDLSKLKSMLVNGQGLSSVAKKLRIGEFVLMSDNEARNGGRDRLSILEDTFEALVGAMYQDGGEAAVRNFIQKNVLPNAEKFVKQKVDYNYKSQLLEFLQAKGVQPPTYRVLSENGPDHEKLFSVEVLINGKMMGSGIGKSKKSAQQEAALSALKVLNNGKTQFNINSREIMQQESLK